MSDTYEIREKIAVATKILLAERMIGPFGHCSARVPDTNLVAILGHKDDHVKDASQITSDDVVLIDESGSVIEGDLEVPGERHIHLEIYKKRPDVQAVVHAHPYGCVAFSIVGRAPKTIWHLSTVFAEGIPILDSSIQIDTPELGEKVAEKLGSHKAVLLKGHGVAVVGSSVEDATVSAVSLERSAQLEITASSLGEVREIPPSELTEDLVSIGLTKDEFVRAQWDYWAFQIETQRRG
jgi:L-fuculose-phosphate aldolase